MKLYSNRSGSLYYNNDYECYIPNPISSIVVDYDEELANLLSRARMVLGNINLLLEDLENKDIYLSMFIQNESVVSSQIEGTQLSLNAHTSNDEENVNYEDIAKYIKTLKKGIKLVEATPISNDFIKELHKMLFEDDGSFRNNQSWIGNDGSSLKNAYYIPPCVDKLDECLEAFNNDLLNKDNMDPLIKLALINYQFDTIHPFIDGNGRIGRILIPLYLKEKNVLSSPFICMSKFLNESKNEYYRLLMDTRLKGTYEEWIKFFLEGLIFAASEAFSIVRHLKALDNDIKKEIHNLKLKNEEMLINALNYFYYHPYFKSHDLVNNLNISKPTANSIINTFIDLEIITPIDDKLRNSTYRFNEYINLFE